MIDSNLKNAKQFSEIDAGTQRDRKNTVIEKIKHSTTHGSAVHLLLILILGIFIGEVTIMLFIDQLLPLSQLGIALLDSTLLLILVFPFLYFFVFHPMGTYITEHKQLEDELYLARDYNRNLIEVNIDPLVTISSEGMLMDVNHATELATGLSRDELIGKYFANYFTEPEKAEAGYQKVLAEGLVKDYALTIRHTSGKLTPVLYNASVYRNQEGNIQGIFAAARNITELKKVEEDILNLNASLEIKVKERTAQLAETNENLQKEIEERKQAEETLRESEQRFHHLFEVSPEAVMLIDPFDTNVDWPIVDCNETACKMNGYAREELIGKSIDIVNITYGTPEERAGYMEKLRNARIMYMETFHRHRNGHIFPVEVSTSIVTFLGREIILGIDRDITERKQAEAEIKKTNKELIKLNTEKDKFFSIIAHDLRGPLGGLMGLTEVMADDSQNITPDQKKQLTLGLSRSARNIFNLLENLLEWSQMQSGYTEVRPQMLSLKKVLNESLKVVNDSAKNKAIEIAVEIAGEHKIFADSNMLQTVVRNLVSNAIKFTPKGGKVTISAKPEENNAIVIAVKDTGIGMNREVLDNLFHIDTKNHRPGTEGEPSTGLGLLLCKEIIAKHGGKIGVKSEEGKGSVFYFTLPFVNETDDKEQPPVIIEDENHIPGKFKILIVDDDETSLMLLKIMVKPLASNLFQAITGKEAIEICRINPDIDLVLMDIDMPGMDGHEATRQIREFNNEVVIIAQTAVALTGEREKAMEAGCNDYILKPINKEKLLGLIQKYLKK